jgi:uncharacterized surface protein with fasciclin (FAS1) repeats
MTKNVLSKLKTAKVSKDHKKTNSISTVELIMEDPSFKLFRRALKLTGLMDLLTDGTVYTLYAPTDDAFYTLGETVVEQLFRKANHEYLKQLMLYHISPKTYYFSSLYNYTTLPTLLGVRLPVADLSIDTGDIRLSDSVVHTVNDLTTTVPSILYPVFNTWGWYY